MTSISLLLIALWTWRTAFFVTSEDGPYNVAGRFRTWAPLGGLTTCLRCASVWTALLGFLLWTFGGQVGQAVVTVGALSGAALMLAAYSGASHV